VTHRTRTRKVIQITVQQETSAQFEVIHALCDDGTIWELTRSSVDARWVCVMDVPQDDPEPCRWCWGTGVSSSASAQASAPEDTPDGTFLLCGVGPNGITPEARAELERFRERLAATPRTPPEGA